LSLACALAGAADAEFAQQGEKLDASDAVGNASQGYSVALSADGNTAIVGGYYDDSYTGAAWVYTRSGDMWTQQGSKLVGTGAVGNASQGWSVALSSDGNTAIVGGASDNGGAGAVWLYTRSDGVWTQQGTKLTGSGSLGGAMQGFSVALSGDCNTAIVGGPQDDGGAGAVWVYTRSGNVWTQQGSKLVGTGAVNGIFGGNQGSSVALSADGNTAVVGGARDNNFAGALWVFTRTGGVWTQQGNKLTGIGAVGNAFQGDPVAMSGDGNTVIEGGFNDNGSVGAAWVFTRSGGVWTQQGSKLVGTGAVQGSYGSYQGYSVALSANGNTAMVGGARDNNLAGATWVFTRSGGVWTQTGSKLVGAGAVGNAFQGSSLAMSGDANTAIVGGTGDNSGVGAAWVFTSPAPAKIGTYNAGQWALDMNGNGGASGTLNASFGWPGATYVTGDWSGNGHTKIGVYYNGFWYLDYDGNGVWDGGVNDKQYTFGWADPNVIPVVGDWNGDGRAKIGIYYQGFWYLDYDGNGIWDGGVNDKAYNFGWPATGVIPMVGDWSGTGTAKIGVYYYGFWYLDYNGNGVWDGATVDKAYNFGWAATGVTPIMGDWNADGRAKIGIYYNGFWYLDYDGNGLWDGGIKDKAYTFGWSGVTPLVGDWSASGTTKIGIYTNGSWFLDFIGNGIWDGGIVDKAYVWGQAGDTPIVGKW
jgi:hypothetical protein